MKIKLATLFLIFIPVAVFLAGVSRPHRVTVHVGMTHNEISRILKSASAIEISRPDSYSRVQTQGSPESSTYWKLPGSRLTIETVRIGGADVVNGLYLDRAPTKKLEIHNRGAQIVPFDRLSDHEREAGIQNRPRWGGGFAY